MKFSLSPENEQRLKWYVDAGKYADLDSALNSILTNQLEWLEMVRSKIEEADADLREGRFTDYDEEELRAFFADLKNEAGISSSASSS